MALTPDQLNTQIDRLVEDGDESALEAFLIEHFADLPEEAQGKMLLSYFADAVERRSADTKITELQEKALKALEVLQKKDQ